jgi:hypothetical protein
MTFLKINRPNDQEVICYHIMRIFPHHFPIDNKSG